MLPLELLYLDVGDVFVAEGVDVYVDLVDDSVVVVDIIHRVGDVVPGYVYRGATSAFSRRSGRPLSRAPWCTDLPSPRSRTFGFWSEPSQESEHLRRDHTDALGDTLHVQNTLLAVKLEQATTADPVAPA